MLGRRSLAADVVKLFIVVAERLAARSKMGGRKVR